MVFMGFWRAVKRELRREGEGEEAEPLSPALSPEGRGRLKTPSPACFAGTLSPEGRWRVDSLNARVDCMAQGLLEGECFGGDAIVWRGLDGGKGEGGRCGF